MADWLTPNDAEITQSGTPQFYSNFFDKHQIYVTRQQGQVLVVSPAFNRQDPDSGAIEWLWERDDEESTRSRVEGAVRIYEHLSTAGKPWHNCIVRYMSRHEVGYLLEKFYPGPIRFKYPSIHTSVGFLAIYQRWALQLISALHHLHTHGIILNAMTDDSLWLRDDFSIAIANFINAGCDDVRVSAGLTMSSQQLESQWSPAQMYDTMEDDKIYPGVPWGDIFDWATTVYRFMSGDMDPLRLNDVEWNKRAEVEREIATGEFSDWPELEEKQLGPILVRAWRGEYSSAAEVLKDVKALLSANGCTLDGDDIIGINWREDLELVEKGDNESELRLRSDDN